MIMITGFGAFRTYNPANPNPSGVVAKSLNGLSAPHGSKILGIELPVEYVAAARVLTSLYASRPLRLVIHVGVSSRTTVDLEAAARNSPYAAPDAQNHFPPHGTECVPGGAARLSSLLNVDALVTAVGALAPAGVAVRRSDDAGLFLCEYTYYTTLHQNPAPALFVHVPPFDARHTPAVMQKLVFDIAAEAMRQLYGDAPPHPAPVFPPVTLPNSAGGADGGGSGSGSGEAASSSPGHHAAAAGAHAMPTATDALWVADYARRLASDPNMSSAIAAIETLIAFISQSDAATLAELRDGLTGIIAALTRSTQNNITSISSGSELFLRFITLKADYVKSFAECKRQLVLHGQVFLNKAVQGRAKIARKGAPFVRDGAVVLTHSRSRVVVSVLRAAAADHKRFTVLVTEARPGESGKEMAALLREAGIPVTLIPDSAVGYVMERVDMVMVGAEAVVESGGIINTTGTYPIAVMANVANKPFYVVGESFKFVRVFPLGQGDIPSRGGATATATATATTTATAIAPATATTVAPAASLSGAGAFDDAAWQVPALDYTPPGLITLLVTDIGILTPSAVSDELIKLYY